MTTEFKSAAHNQLPSKSHCVCHYTVYYPVNYHAYPATEEPGFGGSVFFIHVPQQHGSAQVSNTNSKLFSSD